MLRRERGLRGSHVLVPPVLLLVGYRRCCSSRRLRWIHRSRPLHTAVRWRAVVVSAQRLEAVARIARGAPAAEAEGPAVVVPLRSPKAPLVLVLRGRRVTRRSHTCCNIRRLR